MSTYSDVGGCNTQHSAVVKGHFWWLETTFLLPVCVCASFDAGMVSAIAALNVPLPQSQSHSATYRFPPSLAHPLPSIEHLYSPNPSFQLPPPSAPSNSLRPFFPAYFYQYQQQQPYHHNWAQEHSNCSTELVPEHCRRGLHHWFPTN